jgi:hypothetical protein
MSGTNEGFVQIPPDSTGKQIDAFQVTTNTGTILYRQGVAIADNSFPGWAADVDEQNRLYVKVDDKGFLTLIADDIQNADGQGPGLLKPPYATADGSEPSLVVQISPNSVITIDQSQPTIIGGVGPDGMNRLARIGKDGGLQLSDSVGQTYTLGASGTVFILDTSGYQSISVQLSGTWAGTVNFYCSNDMQTWQTVQGVSSTAPNGPIVSATANTQTVFPLMGRYFKVSYTWTSGLLVVVPYLRSAPAPAAAINVVGIGGSSVLQAGGVQSINTAQFNGTGVVNAGIAGMLAVGGNIAAGSAPTAYPVLAGGIDTVGNVRRLETDVNGAPIAAGVLAPGYQLSAYNVTFSKYTVANAAQTLTQAQSTIAPVMTGGLDQTNAARPVLTDYNGAVLVGSEPSTPANQSIQELLMQMVALMRVQAHYLYEIRSANNPSMTSQDEPDSLLADFLNPATSLLNMIN